MPIALTFTHDGTQFVGLAPAQLAARGVPDSVVIAAVKAGLKTAIDAEAERRRLLLITPGTGQAMEYGEAQAQAEAALADTAASPGKYPMLAASIAIDIDPQTGRPAVDVAGVARAVLAARDAWLSIGAALRQARLVAKAAIDAAPTMEAATAVEAAWPA